MAKLEKKVINGLETMGLLQIRLLTHKVEISQESFFIIIDEAQNLTPLK